MQPTDNRSVVLEKLVDQQKQTREGSPAWYAYQQEINQIIAENFLLYVNR
jgi:hypothetical protein